MAINPIHMSYLTGNNIRQAGRDQYLITLNDYADPNLRTRAFLLEAFKPALMDASRQTKCDPATHATFLASVLQWTNDISEQRSVYWINSPAQVGKSTVATTIASHLDAARQLGAFLFFDQGDAERRDPGLVIRTIACQMGRRYPCLGKIIAAAIEKTSDFPPFQEQFQQFILEPLLTQQSTTPDSSSSGRGMGGGVPVVVVLDGLDQCGDPNTRQHLLEALAKVTVGCSSFFRMIVTSRATTDIHNALLHKDHIISYQLDVTDNHSGILTYLQRRARETDIHLSDEDLHFIAKRACGWFPWAIAAWPDMHNPTKHLEMLLEGQSPQRLLDKLDDFYRPLLEFVDFGDDEDEDDEFIRDFRAILGVVITAKIPLSSIAIDHLLGSSLERSSLRTISRLRSILFDDRVVRLLHPSLGSFLSNRDQCEHDIWFVDPVTHTRSLAVHCLELMNGTLEKVILEITSPSRLETTAIPEALAYACKHWIDHICDVEKDVSPVLVQLHTFLNQHLRRWFQAMRLLKRRDAIAKLHKLSKWIAANFPVQNCIFELVRNAWYALNNLFGYPAPEFPNSIRLHEVIEDAYQSEERPLVYSLCALPVDHT